MPTPKKQVDGPGRTPLELREVINAILYVMRSGCSWGLLPNDYPNHKSVYHYYNTWSKQGMWEKIHVKLVKKVRKVERSFAWLSFNRRLSKDYKKLPRNSESALYVAMLPMMLRRLS